VAKLGYDDIVMNSCITSANVAAINRLADKAKEWGVNICFSSYAERRTGCRDFSLTSPEQLALLNSELDRVEVRRDKTNRIVNSPTTLAAIRQFFLDGTMPGCKAGHRFLVVTGDGWLQPCSMIFKRYRLEDRQRRVEEFTNRTAAATATSPFVPTLIRLSRNFFGRTSADFYR
jgi:MoaA/NifB/PqqE/SkfB family radical SAM enzyme